MRCECGGFLIKAEFDMIEDDSFYLNMECEDCEKAYSIETEPVYRVSDSSVVELGYWQSINM